MNLSVNNYYSLNRLSLNYKCSANELNPIYVIGEVFEYMSLEEILGLFDQFCKAAQASTYNWSGNSPGSLLKFVEDIEQLIEAGFLFLINDNHRLRKQLNYEKLHVSIENLPIHLNSSEYRQPLLFLESFFSFQTINQWKSILHEWLYAGLSSMSITELTNNAYCFSFHDFLRKLIEALWLVKERVENKN